jgi:hypothetical protein
MSPVVKVMLIVLGSVLLVGAVIGIAAWQTMPPKPASSENGGASNSSSGNGLSNNGSAPTAEASFDWKALAIGLGVFGFVALCVVGGVFGRKHYYSVNQVRREPGGGPSPSTGQPVSSSAQPVAPQSTAGTSQPTSFVFQPRSTKSEIQVLKRLCFELFESLKEYRFYTHQPDAKPEMPPGGMCTPAQMTLLYYRYANSLKYPEKLVLVANIKDDGTFETGATPAEEINVQSPGDSFEHFFPRHHVGWRCRIIDSKKRLPEYASVLTDLKTILEGQNFWKTSERQYYPFPPGGRAVATQEKSDTILSADQEKLYNELAISLQEYREEYYREGAELRMPPGAVYTPVK